MHEPEAVWGTLLATGVAYEVVALWRRRHATLSTVTRSAFRTETVAGRRIFGICLAASALWFGAHILWPERTPSL